MAKSKHWDLQMVWFNICGLLDCILCLLGSDVAEQSGEISQSMFGPVFSRSLSSTDSNGTNCGLNNVPSLDSNRTNCGRLQGFSLRDPNDPNGDCKLDFTPSCDEGIQLSV